MTEYNKEKIYWDSYYSENNPDIIASSSFSNYINETYLKPHTQKGIVLNVADLGCGNMRDSQYFSENNCNVYAIDKSFDIKKSVVQYKNNKFLNPINADVDLFLQEHSLRSLMDVIYMRWFMHAVPYPIGHNIFSNSVFNLKPGGLICIEVRSINDELLKNESHYDNDDLSYKTTHKRWLYGKERLTVLSQENNIEILEMKESRGFSSTSVSNPLLIRFIGRKKLINHFEKSENFNLYRPITEKMQNAAKKSYNDLIIFNAIIEKHNIKYVSVAGSTLGLCRHGGIIPWDNDIDLGFTKINWIKLNRIRYILEAAGLRYTRNNYNHFHYGTIDVFLLVENKYKFLCGDAKTICHVSEYATVAKQLFGPTYIYAPLDNRLSLKTRYKDTYYTVGDVNDNFHYKNKDVGRFILNNNDRSFRAVFAKRSTIIAPMPIARAPMPIARAPMPMPMPIAKAPTEPNHKKNSSPIKLHRKLNLQKINMQMITF